MEKHVVILASGVAEHRALPHLTAHLCAEGIYVDEIRYPPRHGALTVETAAKLIKAAWFASMKKPQKFVILMDVDGKSPEDVLRPFRDLLASQVSTIPATLQFAFAQRHLEAWFFADSANLREYLGQALGSVDCSNPDEIQNPKLHLAHLLGERQYTAVVSDEIASELDASVIEGRSPSFGGFIAAIRNGPIH